MTAPTAPWSRRELAWMKRALTLAARGWGQTAPNPMVGAVVVLEGRVVGTGFHRRYGEAHAEVNALAEAGERARGATLFVTLEPCNHHGKTPPCTEAILAAGIARVVVATLDANPRAAGGAERLRAEGVTVDVGCLEDEARELNAAFFFVQRDASRPFVTLKLAMSVEGAIADATRSRRQLTGMDAQLRVHRLRAQHDAVAVGIDTAIADDPELTVRYGKRPRVLPTRVVFDRRARLPLTSKLAKSARKSPVVDVVATAGLPTAEKLRDKDVQIIVAQDVTAALRTLRAHGIRSLLLEGGATLAAAFLAAGVVDRLIILRAPVFLGPGALPAFVEPPSLDRLRVVARETLGDDQMTVYSLSAF
jgi:diaminohydroxyphosphoribosylaminopyrimidine deaminase/5-amino-6-(5-phosphoribosylamino)uracil reductase